MTPDYAFIPQWYWDFEALWDGVIVGFFVLVANAVIAKLVMHRMHTQHCERCCPSDTERDAPDISGQH